MEKRSMSQSWHSVNCESLPKERGDNHNSVCASAEANVFGQTVALWIAVIPQIARRYHLLVWWLLRAAIIAFATKLWADKRFLLLCHSIHIRNYRLSDQSGKDTYTDADQKYMYRCRAVVSISDCSATAHRRGIFFLHLRQPQKVIVLSIADTSAILRTISLGAQSIPFPTNNWATLYQC